MDWKRKLTSRKFWMAVVGFVTAVLYAFNYSNITVEKITAIIMAGAMVIAYIIGEGMADSANAEEETIVIHGEDLKKMLEEEEK